MSGVCVCLCAHVCVCACACVRMWAYELGSAIELSVSIYDPINW